MKECKDQLGAFFSYTPLKKCYERLLNRCNKLQQPASHEEEEQSLVRTAYIKAFLLLLIGYTIFAGKNSRSVNLLWLLELQVRDRFTDYGAG